MKPKSMRAFDLLYLAMILNGLIWLAVNWNTVIEAADLALVEAGLGERAGDFSRWAIAGGAFLGAAINLALWFLVSVLRIGLFRWVLAALTAWTMLRYATNFEAEGGFDLSHLPGAISNLLAILAIIFLFRPDASAWFRERKDNGAD